MGKEKIIGTVNITPTNRGISLDLGEEGMSLAELIPLMNMIGLGGAVEELKKAVPYMEVE